MPKGCLDKKAALVVMDKDPLNLDRLKKIQEDLIDAKASLMQILVLLRSKNPDKRQRSPPRKVSPRRSSVRNGEAKIKILFVSPFPTDPIKSARPGKLY
jgi:hypothetical protein